MNLWSKKDTTLVHSFEVPGEVASLTSSGNALVCGLINGTLALLDLEKKSVVKVIERAHTGTVVSCATMGELVVSQDDSREIRIWSLSNALCEPLAKLIGRSYNPVWFNQSLCSLQLNDKQGFHFLSAQGAEAKIIHLKYDLESKLLSPQQTSVTNGIPAALA